MFTKPKDHCNHCILRSSSFVSNKKRISTPSDFWSSRSPRTTGWFPDPGSSTPQSSLGLAGLFRQPRAQIFGNTRLHSLLNTLQLLLPHFHIHVILLILRQAPLPGRQLNLSSCFCFVSTLPVLPFKFSQGLCPTLPLLSLSYLLLQGTVPRPPPSCILHGTVHGFCTPSTLSSTMSSACLALETPSSSDFLTLSCCGGSSTIFLFFGGLLTSASSPFFSFS